MHKLSFVVAAAALLSCSTQNKTTMQSTGNNTAANEAGWVSLFDGKTTSGWHTYNKTGVGSAWKAEDGVLHLDAKGKKEGLQGGDIVTDQEFENFHLKYDWKIAPNGNSGVIFYSKEDPQYSAMWNTGPEMQVLDNNGHPDAKIIKHRAGDLYDLITAKEAVKPVGEWNTAEIVANKGKLDFYLNGVHTLSTTMWDDNWYQMIAKSKFKDMPAFGRSKSGRIGLQDHGDEVWFRNIKLKTL
ncbi:3-keto-disaccharide hydrolase [Flavisolibacter nicotianae]|uniref:3-keto-disaccharide hydrolase n=1 Tax=Flavisolibacter nicotianae TaxID=2364882 RepID=UPI000EB10FAD|nr:DUF1080 domain-containing protein [Flavisolibacter nicotianae]